MPNTNYVDPEDIYPEDSDDDWYPDDYDFDDHCPEYNKAEDDAYAKWVANLEERTDDLDYDE